MKNRMDDSRIAEILVKAPVGSLASINENGFPYVVPVHFVYRVGKIFIHGLPQGQKIDNIGMNTKVGFGIYEMKGLIPDESPCETNTKYESIVISGTAALVSDYDVKKTVLNSIVSKYTPYFSNAELPDSAINGTAVIEITVIKCTGKYY